MDQLIQWMFLFTAIGVLFGGITYYAINDLEIDVASQHDMMESEKLKSGEKIKLVDSMNNPFRLDLMNIGLTEIEIKKLFVDGNEITSYQLTDRFGVIVNNLPLNEIVTLTTGISGNQVTVISDNNKVFIFD